MNKLGFLLAIIICASTANAQFINIDKQVYKPGEKIVVSFSSERDLPDDAWIGILPAWVEHGSEAVNDKHDITYQYLKNGTRGTLIFTAPNKEGKYDFRLNDSDSNGEEIAMTYFEVSANPPLATSSNNPAASDSPASTKYLSLQRTHFKPGETIVLQFTAPSSFANDAWVGIVPSSVSHGSEANNDKNDLAYQYLKKRTSGTLTFTAPLKVGNYDFRMNDTDSNGKEVASLSFVVSNTSVNTQQNNAGNANIAGTYSTDFNKMTLQISGNYVTGTYEYAGGRVEGTLSGHTLTGTWTQNNGKGKMLFVFNNDFSSFTGKWGYNDAVPTSTWNGHK